METEEGDFMRVSRAQAAENRERILGVASELFRERGIDGVGVADLMQSAGLTHGGFYGHFDSKEDLVAQACALAISKTRERWMKVVDGAEGEPLKALGETYLTPRHRDHAGRGCLMASLGPEVSRQGARVRKSVTQELRGLIAALADALPGRTRAARRKQALAAYTSLVGALVVARTVDDAKFSDEILQAAASFLQDAARAQGGPEASSRRRSRVVKARKAASRA